MADPGALMKHQCSRLELVRCMRGILLSAIILVGVACSGRVPLTPTAALAVQEAAVESVTEPHADEPACLHMSAGPGTKPGERLMSGLHDPSADLLQRLRDKGIKVQPFSSCKKSTAVNGEIGWLRGEIVVGWPTPTAHGAKVQVDTYCGGWCGGGYTLELRRGPQGWQIVGISDPWMT